jgi:hypothetical protein
VRILCTAGYAAVTQDSCPSRSDGSCRPFSRRPDHRLLARRAAQPASDIGRDRTPAGHHPARGYLALGNRVGIKFRLPRSLWAPLGSVGWRHWTVQASAFGGKPLLIGRGKVVKGAYTVPRIRGSMHEPQRLWLQVGQ